MFVSKVFSFFFVCMLSACGNSILQTENANQTQPKEKMELSLRMERSGCYGTCPAYELNIQPDGKILFNGVDFTETKGKAESSLSEEKIKQLIAEIEKANFFSLDDNYNYGSPNCLNLVTDSSSVTLYIKLSEKEKTINHYLGCLEDEKPKDYFSTKKAKDLSETIFPQQLYILENKIDEIVETKRWIGE